MCTEPSFSIFERYSFASFEELPWLPFRLENIASTFSCRTPIFVVSIIYGYITAIGWDENIKNMKASFYFVEQTA